MSGYPGTFWADIQWNSTYLAFIPIAAGQETSPAFYDKTELLKDKWHFVYTIALPPAFTNDYTTIPGTTNSQGGYYINGTGDFGRSVVGAYWPTDRNWTLLDAGSIIDRYYTFYTDGTSILPNSSYRQLSHSTGDTSACYALSGSKVGPADTSLVVPGPDNALAPELLRERDAAAGFSSERAQAEAAVMEKYWILKGVLGR